MPTFEIFLESVCGGSLFGLFALLLARDIIRVKRHNRKALEAGRPRVVFRLLADYAFGGLSLGTSITFFIFAVASALALLR